MHNFVNVNVAARFFCPGGIPLQGIPSWRPTLFALTTETAWELTSFLCRNQGAIKFQELMTSIGDKKI